MRTNEWFLSDELTDFSQVVTTDTVYVVPGGENPSDPDAAFSIYDVDEAGNIQWNCTAYPPANASVPFEFSGLTYEVIHHALSGIEHEDYIITYAPTLGIVFIWARGTAEDTILAYPTRPDLLELENGGFYTSGKLYNGKNFAITVTLPETTDVENVVFDKTHVEKLMREGQIIISIDGVEYDLQGRLVNQ